MVRADASNARTPHGRAGRALLRDDDGAQRRSAERRSRSSRRALDVALLRGPRDAMLALAGVVTRRHLRERHERDVARRIRSPRRIGITPRARVGADPRTPRRAVRRAASSRDTRRSRCGRRRSSALRWSSSSTARRTRRGAAESFSTSDRRTRPRTRPDDSSGPVLVARQAEPGVEVICGMTRDLDFGPILAVGRGGVAVEEADSV